MTACRRLTRRSLILSAAGSVALAHAGMRGQAAGPVLRMLCWPEFDDAEVTKGFRNANDAGIQVRRIGANDEIFTFLRAGGIGAYDVVTPTNGVVQALARAELIQPIDLGRLRNAGKLFPRFQNPEWAMLDGQTYAVPLSWHTYPMVYNADHLSAPPARWTDLTDPRFRGKVVMNDDVIAHFLVWNRALGAVDPARVTVAELNETETLLKTIKRTQVLAYVGPADQVASALASGGGWVTTSGSEIVPKLKPARGANLRLAWPDPGDISVCHALCLAAGAPNLDLAYALLDHLISAEAQVALARKLRRGTVSQEAADMLDGDARDLFQYEDLDALFARSPLAGFPPLETDTGPIANYVDWVLAWDRIRFTPLEALKSPTAGSSLRPGQDSAASS